jgi:hypothetical protein
MATNYNTEFSVTIEPVYGLYPPYVEVGLDGKCESFSLTQPHTCNFSLDLAVGTHKFWVSLIGKLDSDPVQAVKITRIEFEGISVDRMLYAGIYYPKYPAEWAAQHSYALPTTLPGANYLGWNGLWELEFTVPVFTWIHKLENLGWIYHTIPSR